ncbi:hypothetical protein BTB1458_2476 [Mycobacterium tuberculosis]|nr:hypothetical protein BTB1458_2476 [Mycobacterium tuberculosis]
MNADPLRRRPDFRVDHLLTKLRDHRLIPQRQRVAVCPTASSTTMGS